MVESVKELRKISVQSNPNPKRRLLRITNSIGHTSSAFNNFSLPMQDFYEIGICTLSCESKFQVSEKIKLYDANNSIRRFFSLLHRACKDIRPQIIHVHHPQAAVLSLLYLLFFQRRTHRVYTIHSMFCNYRFSHKAMILIIALFYDRIICCSKSAFRSMPKLYKYLVRKKTQVIQNGVDLDRVDQVISSCYEKPKDFKLKVINVGRLIEAKNQKTLIKVFKKIANDKATLSIIGAGELEKELRELAADDSSIEFSGTYPRDDVFRLLKKADLFVSTSLWEGLPVAVLEAMACGCPIILSDIEPHREIAQGTDFIPLVTPNDIDGFFVEINKMMELSDDERKAIGKKCRAHVENKLSVTKMCQSYEELYNRMVKEKQ